MRLIDADALQKAIPDVEADFFENCGNCNMLSKEDVLKIMDDQPTVDAVPVIRCKDCTFGHYIDYGPMHCLHPRRLTTHMSDALSRCAERKGKKNGRMD